MYIPKFKPGDTVVVVKSGYGFGENDVINKRKLIITDVHPNPANPRTLPVYSVKNLDHSPAYTTSGSRLLNFVHERSFEHTSLKSDLEELDKLITKKEQSLKL